jgi:hypothetical protein
VICYILILVKVSFTNIHYKFILVAMKFVFALLALAATASAQESTFFTGPLAEIQGAAVDIATAATDLTAKEGALETLVSSSTEILAAEVAMEEAMDMSVYNNSFLKVVDDDGALV